MRKCCTAGTPEPPDLADIVRTYIETGEPVSSARHFQAVRRNAQHRDIRNLMADLEDGGFLYQPHTSAGRVPTRQLTAFSAGRLPRRRPSRDRPRVDSARDGRSHERRGITEARGHILRKFRTAWASSYRRH